jgi:hypothetical protein
LATEFSAKRLVALSWTVSKRGYTEPTEVDSRSVGYGQGKALGGRFWWSAFFQETDWCYRWRAAENVPAERFTRKRWEVKEGESGIMFPVSFFKNRGTYKSDSLIGIQKVIWFMLWEWHVFNILFP